MTVAPRAGRAGGARWRRSAGTLAEIDAMNAKIARAARAQGEQNAEAGLRPLQCVRARTVALVAQVLARLCAGGRAGARPRSARRRRLS